MTARTQPEIDAEIAALQAAKLTFPKRNKFGDDNHDAIDAQIEVLRAKLDDDTVHDTFGPQGDPDDEDFDENDYDGNLLDNALDACRWLWGDTESRPSGGWRV